MIQHYKNIYRDLKARDKIEIREKNYLDLLTETLTSMFKWTTDDYKLNRALNMRLEFYLRYYGKVAFFKNDNNELVFARCHFGFGIDEFGFTDEIIATTEDGKVYNLKDNDDCVVMFNNNIGQSELTLYRVATQLSENDLSQVDLLLNARNHPIIVVKDEETRVIVERAISNSEIGKPKTVASSDDLISDIMGNNNGENNSIKVVNITDPQTAELFQYYSHYHLDLTSRFYGTYGLSTFNTGKMAQTNNAEVTGTLASSMAIPFDNYHCRERAIEEVNKMFGTDIKLEFSECWKNQASLFNAIDVDEFNIDVNDDAIVDNDTAKIEDENAKGDNNNE